MSFHFKAPRVALIDKLAFVTVISLFAVVPPDVLVILIYVFMVPYLFLTHRRRELPFFMLASALALAWMLLAQSQYGYNQAFLSFYGLNLFALFAWATGLFGAYLLSSHWEALLPIHNKWRRLGLFLLFYWPILISAETLFYHVFNVQNLATANYAGLPICNCLHAPQWMQIAYFALGPLYFMLCEIIKKTDFVLDPERHYIMKCEDQ